MNRRTALPSAIVLGLVVILCLSISNLSRVQAETRRPLKVVIVAMFGNEGDSWIKGENLTDDTPIPGFSATYPNLHCNAQDVCLLVTDQTYANAATTVMALLLNPKFDLTQTYFIVAGIAGINPADGTLGTAAWARYAVDMSAMFLIDRSETPKDWKTSYFGLGVLEPGKKPTFINHTEVYQLDEKLLQKAFGLSKAVTLADNDNAKKYRAHYPDAPANQPPVVTLCDTVSSNTWFYGKVMADTAKDWAKLMTDGKANYCTTQEEDNATLTALTRGSLASLVDFKRVAVLRAASDFDQPYPNLTPIQGLGDAIGPDTGAFPIALENLYRAAKPLVDAIASNWDQWKSGVPMS